MSRRGDNIHKRKDGRWEGLRSATDKLDSKNFYAFNPSFDKHCNKR